MGDRVTLAEKLLDGYRSKALELLVDYLRNEDVRAATEQYIGQHNSTPARPEAVIEQHVRASTTHPRHVNPSLPRRSTRQNIPDARLDLHTPSNSAGSVKSHASSLAAAGLERIYLISCDHDGAEQPVIARSALVKHNLIGDKVVYGRGFGSSTDLADEPVSVHLPSGGQRWERVTRSVTLTWRRRNEFKTNIDTFFIVPARLLDSDAVLNLDESLEPQLPSDVEEAYSPQARHQQRGFVAMEELDPAVPPRAPTAPVHGYEQNVLPLNVQRTYDQIQAVQNIHRMNLAERSTPTSPPRHVDHGQANNITTPSAAQGLSSGQLQVSGLWDKTPIKMSLDPDASGEVFYQDFCKWASRRNRDGDIERNKMTLWFKSNKNTRDDEAYDLSLNEHELEDLWEDAISWIQDHKNPRAPHLYATVELESG